MPTLVAENDCQFFIGSSDTRLAMPSASSSQCEAVSPRCNEAAASAAVSVIMLALTADLACRGDLHGAISIVKRDGDVAALARAFATLSQSALPPESSTDLIRNLARAEWDRS
jgi:hypothetical protein